MNRLSNILRLFNWSYNGRFWGSSAFVNKCTWELFPSEPLHRMRGVCALRGLLWNSQKHKLGHRRLCVIVRETQSVFSLLPADLLHWELPLELVLPDSRCASSSIFSSSPSWMDVVGIWSWLPWWLALREPVPLKWSSTQEPKNQHTVDAPRRVISITTLLRVRIVIDSKAFPLRNAALKPVAK